MLNGIETGHPSWEKGRWTLSLAIVLAALVFVIYFSVPWRRPGGDNVGYYLCAASMVIEGNMNLDEYASQLSRFAVREHRGHLYSTYANLPALLLYPLFELAYFLRLHVEPAKLAAFAAVLYLSITSAVLFLILVKITGRLWAALLTLGFALASPVFSNCAADFWSHIPGLLFICIGMYLATRPTSPLATLGLGLSLALAVGARPFQLIPAAILLLFWIPRQRRRHWFILSAPIALVALGITAINTATSGDWAGAYANAQLEECRGFSDPALWSFLFSPSRGMLVYFPLTLLAFWALARRARRIRPSVTDSLRGMRRRLWKENGSDEALHLDGLADASALIVFFGVLFYASWWGWDGGWCYGCRFASDLAPWILISVAMILREDEVSKPAKLRSRLLTALLVLLGLLMNLPGAAVGYTEWCVETGVKDVWSLQRSQAYCAWRSLLGLDNDQLLIHLRAHIWHGPSGEPWVALHYENPTEKRHATLWAAVWGRDSSDEDHTFCEVHRGPTVLVSHHESKDLRFSLARYVASCRHRQIRVDFGFTHCGLKKGSNVASVEFAR